MSTSDCTPERAVAPGQLESTGTIPTVPDNGVLSFTVFASKNKPQGKRKPDRTWRGFYDAVLAKPPADKGQSKDSLPGWSPATFTGDKRAGESVETLFALTLDFDGKSPVTIDDAVKAWPGVVQLIHTTFSHTPKCPRFRQILPLSRAVTATEYATIWNWGASRLRAVGFVFDESCRDPSRLWFLPLRREHYEHRWIDGGCLDVDEILEAGTAAASVPPVSSTNPAPRTSPFDDINRVPMHQVASALGLDPERPVCPFCGKATDPGNKSQITFGFADTNLFKCQHAACGSKATNNIGLIAKVEFGFDDAHNLPKDVCRNILSWARDRLGIRLAISGSGTPRTMPEPRDPQPLIDALPRPLPTGPDRAKLMLPIIDAIATQPRIVWQHYIHTLQSEFGLLRGDIRKEVESRAGQHDHEDDTADSPSNTLVDILHDLKLAKTSTGRIFGEFGAEALPADSRAFLARVAAAYFTATSKLLPKDTLQNALAVVFGEGLPVREMPIRFAARSADEIVIDMADAQGRAISITKSGISVGQSPVAFLRPDGTRPLPDPVFPDDALQCQQWLADYRDLIGARAPLTWASVIGFELSSSRPMEIDGELSEYTGLRIKAPEGAGKTTFARLVRSALDPRDPDVIALPKDTANLAIIAENLHELTFDNLSHIDAEMSDALCRTATGDGYLTRSLYTNRELTVFKGSKPIIMTSITDVAKNPDLLDRFLVARIERPEKRTTKKKVLAAFRGMHPRVLGAFCFLIREALKHVQDVEVPADVRMQEACAFAMAAERAAGLPEGAIIEAYRDAKRDGEAIVSSEPLVEALLAYLAPEQYVEPVQEISLDDSMDDGALYLPVAKSDAVSAHLSELTRLACPDTDKAPKDWPQTSRGLRAKLDRLVGSLVAYGITIDFGGKSDRAGQAKDRTWTFHRSFARMDTLPKQTCPPTCPPNVSTICAENQSAFRQMDTSDTSSPDFWQEEDVKETSATAKLTLASDVLLRDAGEPETPINVSNVSIEQDRAENTPDQMDTSGGHFQGHVPEHNVSTSIPAEHDDKDDDDDARHIAYRAVFGHGMNDDESVN